MIQKLAPRKSESFLCLKFNGLNVLVCFTLLVSCNAEFLSKTSEPVCNMGVSEKLVQFDEKQKLIPQFEELKSRRVGGFYCQLSGVYRQ